MIKIKYSTQQLLGSVCQLYTSEQKLEATEWVEGESSGSRGVIGGVGQVRGDALGQERGVSCVEAAVRRAVQTAQVVGQAAAAVGEAALVRAFAPGSACLLGDSAAQG